MQKKQFYETPKMDSNQLVHNGVQTLVKQYGEIFERARIGDIRQSQKWLNQVNNYCSAYVKKHQGEESIGQVLEQNKQVIGANVVGILIKRSVINMNDGGTIEHSTVEKIQQACFKPVSSNEVIMDQSQIETMLQDPFKRDQYPGGAVPDEIKVIEKFVVFMHKTKFVPKNQKDLERQVKKSIRFAGVNNDNIDALSQTVIKKMQQDGVLNINL